MIIENVLDYIYIGFGVSTLLFFIFIIYSIAKEKLGVIKSRIFLKYNLFKASIYILFISLILSILSHLGEIFSIEYFHLFGVILHDITMLVFAIILYLTIKPKKQGI
jgi:hypothetical protein